MYGDVLGISTLPAGVILLPYTGGNPILLAVAVLSIVVGSSILASTIVRLVAKKIYNK